MEDLCVAHDFQHIERVVANAKNIQKTEWGDEMIIHIWGLLHESLDTKFLWDTDPIDKEQQLFQFLQDLGISDSTTEEILFIVKNVWFWKSLERWDDFVWSLEFQIVEDADRLEAIGAIAIARCFAYGWKKKSPIYDPNIKSVKLSGNQQYSSNSEKSTSFNHFYEKLLLLKDLMHTQTGKTLAKPRHEFMELYMQRFLDEWEWKY